MADRPDIQQRYNRDEELKPGRPPRTVREPKGAERSSRTPKTRTDPVSGEPQPDPPAPNQAAGDENP